MPIYKDKERNTWYVECSYTNAFGKRRRIKKRGFKTKALAQKYEHQVMLDVQNIKKQVVKTDELFESYIEYKGLTLKARSTYDYRAIYKKHIQPYFGEMYVDKIRIPAIEEWQKKLLEYSFKNEYLIKIQYLLKSLLNYAVRKLQIEDNPFNYIDYVKNKDEKRTEMNFFTPQQYEEFTSMIDNDKYKVLFDMLYWTGMRISELQARTWNDLNFENGDLTIHSNWDNRNNKLTNTTKTKKDRTIYIPEALLNELKELYDKNKKIDGFNDDFFIFGTNRPIPCKTVENAKNRYIERYNDTHVNQIPKIRIHDFRHSHVSYLANNGADVWDIAERLGHSREMVENRYSHMFPEKKNKMKKLLG